VKTEKFSVRVDITAWTCNCCRFYWWPKVLFLTSRVTILGTWRPH